MNKYCKIIISLMLLLAPAVVALGQADDPPPVMPGFQQDNGGPGKGPGHRHGKGGKFMHNEEQRRNLENLRLLKLLELLELDDDQNTKFIIAFSDFRRKMKNVFQATEAKTDELVELIKSDNPNKNEIEAKIIEIDSLRASHFQVAAEFHKKAWEFLTPVQMGKLIIFENRFERELIETVRGFRGGMRNRPEFKDEF